jgi:acetylornithine/N-succinyldiaminopimelate aminotransferase
MSTCDPEASASAALDSEDSLDESAVQANDIHFDQYGGKRLPYVCLSATGIHQTLMSLEGASHGKTIDVLDASGGYGTACLGAAHPVVLSAVRRSLETDGYVTDEVASVARSNCLLRLFGENGYFSQWATYRDI